MIKVLKSLAKTSTTDARLFQSRHINQQLSNQDIYTNIYQIQTIEITKQTYRDLRFMYI